MTSANVVEYTISKEYKAVGYFRKNIMCLNPPYSELLKYQPLNEHMITAYGYDEEDDYWEEEPENLEKFMIRCKYFDVNVRRYFSDKIKK
jgi:hypothetical protein